MPRSGLKGWYLPWVINHFEKDSCDPASINHKISKDQLDALVDELNLHPLALDSPLLTHTIIAVSSVILFLGGILLGIFVNIYLTVISVLGLGLYVYTCCRLTLDDKQRANDRRAAFEKIIDKHIHSTFAHSDVKIALSPLGSYLSIQFCWKDPQCDIVCPEPVRRETRQSQNKIDQEEIKTMSSPPSDFVPLDSSQLAFKMEETVLNSSFLEFKEDIDKLN
mgnify:CR=1 FL=1